jgi:hypothetical protein
MKSLAIAAMVCCASLAFGQSTFTCNTTNDTTICKSSSGRVNEITYYDGHYSSTDYTAAEWAAELARRDRHNKSVLANPQTHVDACLSGSAHDSCLRITASCSSTAKKYTKAQCAQVHDFLNAPSPESVIEKRKAAQSACDQLQTGDARRACTATIR